MPLRPGEPIFNYIYHAIQQIQISQAYVLYNRRITEAFTGLSGFRRIVDDIVIYDSNVEDHVAHVKQFLQCCVELFQNQVTFAGFQLSVSGYQIDESITEAISKYPTPTSRTELRSFIGLVNQLSTSTNTVATLLAPLRPLLSTKNDFVWSSSHEEAFSVAKKSLTKPPVLSFFDIAKPTRLSTDASLQQKTSDEWSLIQAGSRFLSDTESPLNWNYLQSLGLSLNVTYS